jgi:hypothetical protein
MNPLMNSIGEMAGTSLFVVEGEVSTLTVVALILGRTAALTFEPGIDR